MEPQTWQAFFLKLSSFIEDYERNQGRETDVDRITSVRDSAKHFLSTLTEISELLFVSLRDQIKAGDGAGVGAGVDYGGREGQSVDGISSVHEAVHVMFGSYTRTYTSCLGRIRIRTRHTETRIRS